MKNIDLIRQIALFRNLDEADAGKLAEIATEQTFPGGSQIFAEKSTGDSFFIIKYGTVRVFKQGDKGDAAVTTMGNGQHFGEIALIDDAPRSATVEAVENTETIRIKRDDLENCSLRTTNSAMRSTKDLPNIFASTSVPPPMRCE